MKHLLTLVVCLFFCTPTLLADAFVKPFMTFKIVDDKGNKVVPKEVLQIESEDKNFTNPDTINTTSHSGDNYGWTRCKGNKCVTTGYGFKKYQRLLITIDDRQLLTPVFETPKWPNPAYKVTTHGFTAQVSINKGAFIQRLLLQIAFALFVTLLIELLFALFATGLQKWKKIARYIIILNCITLPALWILHTLVALLFFPSTFPFPVIFVYEVVVIILEYLFYRKYLKDYLSKGQIAILAVIANLLSFLLGGICLFFAFLLLA